MPSYENPSSTAVNMLSNISDIWFRMLQVRSSKNKIEQKVRQVLQTSS